MTGPVPHPRAVSTTDHAAPRVIGCTGKTLRRQYRANPEDVPYVFTVGRNYYVSTPMLHDALHGPEAGPWDRCQGCWALGSDEPGFDELHSQPIYVGSRDISDRPMRPCPRLVTLAHATHSYTEDGMTHVCPGRS